ncbi:DUF2834 domain-containing protein [Gluconacetobacter aggeris]|uniref:DUF2834 domain-containing protein n=1 Tax=Gluconacetobacter aggeris TaxID=1286186 RepID=A0A7W4NZU9_9PROT|nr:DUF2834 domain-containing protein [Gluconacetobacter aggeris]MBB2169020.1 DUF2834 domain-containing protein [Gluconacetobacter aggeris]
MSLRHRYFALCVLGVATPYAFFVPWLLDHGLVPGAFIRDLAVNRVSLFFAADVVVSALVLFRFAWTEHRAGRLCRVWPVYAATLLAGVSCGFPLMLFMRQARTERATNRNTPDQPAG